MKALVLLLLMAMVSPAATPKVSPAAISGTSLHLVVLFRPNVDPATAERILSEAELIRLDRPDLLQNQYLIQTTLEAALRLSELDEVAYLYPASEDLVAGMPVNGCLGRLSSEPPIGQFIATFGQGWDGAAKGGAEITYSFSRVSARVPREVFSGIVERALNQWSTHAQIRFRFTGTPGRNNIDFVFASGGHGDPYPFDGRGRVLAHTFYPGDVTPEPFAGDIHFDDDESWGTVIDPDLYSVVLHEVGHSLGLGHSDRPGAVMYPYYRRLESLQADDIAALRRLYAAPSAAAEPGSPTTLPATPVNPVSPSTPVAPSTPAAQAADKTAPAVAITFPATAVYSTSAASIRILGTARDASGIQDVTWTSSTGVGGAAAGGTNWRVDSVPLLIGDNTVTIHVRDAAGNSATRRVTITRR
jgi:hypothetical protein